MSETFLRKALRADAILNIAGAVVLVAGAPTWASVLGLDQTWPIFAFAVLFLVNGTEIWMTSRSERLNAGWLWGLAAVDFAFTAFALAVAVTDPLGAETWARWTLALIGDAAAVTGILKSYGASRLAPTPVSAARE